MNPVQERCHSAQEYVEFGILFLKGKNKYKTSKKSHEISHNCVFLCVGGLVCFLFWLFNVQKNMAVLRKKEGIFVSIFHR